MVASRLARRLPIVRCPFDAISRLELALAAETARVEELSSRLAAAQREAGLARAAPEQIGLSLLPDQAERILDRMDERSRAEIRALALVSANVAGLASRQSDEFRDLRNRLTAGAGGSVAADLYLDLLEAELTGTLHEDGRSGPDTSGDHERARRAVGRDWPASALTMIGTARMQNLRMLVQRALSDDVEGDLVETGVWRGGACIYMRAILAAAGDTHRRVFVADSFRGLPPPDSAAYPADAGDMLHSHPELAVSRQEVEANFRRFGLLDERVVFLEGWFRDTLPSAPVEHISVLRLDGDMYESTMDALDGLYRKVSAGGFVIVDDYHVIAACAQAVTDFRERMGIVADLEEIDGAAVWWRVPGDPPAPRS